MLHKLSWHSVKWFFWSNNLNRGSKNPQNFLLLNKKEPKNPFPWTKRRGPATREKNLDAVQQTSDWVICRLSEAKSPKLSWLIQSHQHDKFNASFSHSLDPFTASRCWSCLLESYFSPILCGKKQHGGSVNVSLLFYGCVQTFPPGLHLPHMLFISFPFSVSLPNAWSSCLLKHLPCSSK